MSHQLSSAQSASTEGSDMSTSSHQTPPDREPTGPLHPNDEGNKQKEGNHHLSTHSHQQPCLTPQAPRRDAQCQTNEKLYRDAQCQTDEPFSHPSLTSQPRQMGSSTSPRGCDPVAMARFVAEAEAKHQKWWDLNRAEIERLLPSKDGGPSLAEIEQKQAMDKFEKEMAEYQKMEDMYKRVISYLPEEDRKYQPYTADMKINRDYVPGGYHCYGPCDCFSDTDEGSCEESEDGDGGECEGDREEGEGHATTQMMT